AGVGVRLRRVRGEREEVEGLEVNRERSGSSALRWLGTAMAAPLALLALYIVAHGHLTPGGGFQGGVILMGAVAAIFLGGEYALIGRMEGSASWVEVTESVGAAGFAALGFGGIIATGAFFYNFVNHGHS